MRLGQCSAGAGTRTTAPVRFSNRPKALERRLDIIAGTHGRGGFERLLLGSVAEALVNFCDTNLVVVPPRAARERRGGATEPSSAQSAA